MTLFESAEDYRAFLRAVGETLRLTPIPICPAPPFSSQNQKILLCRKPGSPEN